MILHQPYIGLRQKHSQFFYKSYTWAIKNNQFECNWHFHTAPNLDFHPSLTIPLPSSFEQKQLDQLTIDWLVFNIGIVESLSYWKATASPKITIEAGGLNTRQIGWWQKLLIDGMGEYFYLNQIDFTQTEFVKIIAKKSATLATGPVFNNIKTDSDSYLIPVGGGKDSIVTLELLKFWQKQHPKVQLLATSLNPTQATKDTIKQSGLSAVFAQRRLDPKLLELNKLGYLNGHTPFSALLAFVNLLIAYLYRYQHVVLSNEQSANEGNVQYLGKTINHQYSKSFAFEQAFRDYTKQTNLANYFSFLRPVNELQIARVFAQVGKNYFQLFRSCNRGQKTNSWCGQCSKCLFAFSILFPFLGEQQVSAIFGQNLFNNPKLIDIALELIGQKATKPFDCVGTYQESLVAFCLGARYYKKAGKPLPVLLQSLDNVTLSQPKHVTLRLSKGELSKDENNANTLREPQSNNDAQVQDNKEWNKQNYLPESLGNFLQTFIKKP